MKHFAYVEPRIFKTIKKHETGITTAIELIGFAATVYLACTEKTKAEKLLEEKKSEIKDIPVKETATIYVKTMWPAVVCGLATSSLITYTNVAASNKIRDLGLAAMMYRDAKDNYEQAVKSRLGDKKADQIAHDAAIISAERSDLHVKGIIDTGHGHELFYDEVTGIWFYSSNQFVMRVAQDFANNIAMKNGGYYSDFIEALDIPSSGKILANTVFLRDRDTSYTIPSLKLEYGTCNENRHELTGEKYGVLTWVGNKPEYVDTDVLYSIDY